MEQNCSTTSRHILGQSPVISWVIAELHKAVKAMLLKGWQILHGGALPLRTFEHGSNTLGVRILLLL